MSTRAYELHEIRPLTLAGCVLGRPTMYSDSGTLREVISLFLGYQLAATMPKAVVQDRSPMQVLDWLGQVVLGNTPEVGWKFVPQFIDRIINHFGSEAEALNKMREFAKSLSEPQPT